MWDGWCARNVSKNMTFDGEIRETNGLLCIEWNIKNYKTLLHRCLLPPTMTSPIFRMRDATWVLGLSHKTRHFLPFLQRLECESERIRYFITCQLTIQINEDEICGGFLNTVFFGEEEQNAIGLPLSLDYLSNRMHMRRLRVLCMIFPEVQQLTSEATSVTPKGVETYSDIIHREGIDLLVSNIKDLFTNEENCDFVIKVRDRNFHVHKTILAARSPVLSAMLQHDMAEKNSSTTTINDCEADVFERFLLYLYTGRVEELSWSHATYLYTLGDKYDIPHLRKVCLQFMEENLSIETFCDAIALAVKHNQKILVKCAEEFFLKNAKSILSTNEWQLLLKENQTICNELFLKHIK